MKSLVNIEYEVRNGKPVILLYLREGENREVREVDWFRPYFYANTYTPQNQLTYMTASGKPSSVVVSMSICNFLYSAFGSSVKLSIRNLRGNSTSASYVLGNIFLISAVSPGIV